MRFMADILQDKRTISKWKVKNKSHIISQAQAIQPSVLFIQLLLPDLTAGASSVSVIFLSKRTLFARIWQKNYTDSLRLPVRKPPVYTLVCHLGSQRRSRDYHHKVRAELPSCSNLNASEKKSRGFRISSKGTAASTETSRLCSGKKVAAGTSYFRCTS